METEVTTNWRELLEQAQNGRRGEVVELVRGDSTEAGCLVNGYLLLAADPERAKELLAKARRSTDADLSCQAAIYEARAYEYLGQRDEGKIHIRELLEGDLLPEYRAQALFVLAVLQVTTPKRALTTLDQISLDDVSPGFKGRAFTLRAKLRSDIGNLDAALVEYAGAAAYFEAAGDTHGLAHVLNNRAGVERRLKLFAAAHESADRAIGLLQKDDPFMAQFLDRKAQIFVSEQRYPEARKIASKAVRFVEGTDRRDVLCENLCTLAQAFAGLKDYEGTASAFAQAATIAEQLDDLHLLYKVTEARKEAALDYVRDADVQLAEIALRMPDGSLRTVAKKLGLSHAGLRKLLARNSQKWKPKKPLRSICKPLK